MTNTIVQGVLLGGYYAVIACGLSFMFSVMRIINLAHGSLAVLAAYLLYVLAARFGISPWVGLLIVLPIMAVIGFLLQRLGGLGTAWLELSGELIQKDLAPGEVLRVHPGHVGAFHSTISFQITMVPGIKNMIFGGDGIFLAQLVGPGTVWLQTLPISRLAHQLEHYLPHTSGREAPTVAGAGLLGGIVGSILSGNE